MSDGLEAARLDGLSVLWVWDGQDVHPDDDFVWRAFKAFIHIRKNPHEDYVAIPDREDLRRFQTLLIAQGWEIDPTSTNPQEFRLTCWRKPQT